MKIAVDLRSLSSGSISGVENYIVNLLEHMIPQDKQNNYTLFYNSWRGQMPGNFHFMNSEVKKTSMPNKILNAGLKLNFQKLEKFTGAADVLFLPNLNPFNINAKTKLAITVHDMSPIVTPEFYNLRRRLWHKFLSYKKSFERADVLFAVSEYTKKDLIRLFDLPEAKIKVVYPGIDHKVFHEDIPQGKLRETRNVFSLPGDYFLFLSTLEPRKNLSRLIQAFNLLDTPAHLVIAGRKGWKYGRIFEEIANSKKRSRIHYIGYLEEQDKPSVMKLARAVVYPSFYEGFGFVPLEAAALGVPSIAGQVTSLPEVTAGASLLVDPYSVESLARSLKDVMADPELVNRLVAKGREVAARYAWEKAGREVLAGLNSLKSDK